MPYSNFSLQPLVKPVSGALALSISIVMAACGGGGSSDDTNTSTTTTSTASGLDTRPVNATCTASSRPVSSSNISLERAYPNLIFNSPVALLQEPANKSRWYLVEQGGQIKWFDASDEDTSTITTYLDFRNIVDARSEGGLLGMAFHPDFDINGQVFLSYTVSAAPSSGNEMVSRITRMRENVGGLSLNTATESLVIAQDQFEKNHNGGQIAFGPDNFLYIGFGDGGGGHDSREQGQDINTLLGALLRLDIDGGMPYAIPPSNPFVTSGGRPELFAYGFRNPWRWSFDSSTGELWLGDVGQSSIEEVDIVVNGGNYGWDCYEGSSLFDDEQPGSQPASCPPASQLTFPVAEYGHDEGRSITGGYVYRGSDIPALQGVYVFGDFVSGTIWGLFPLGNGQYDRRILINSGLSISSFAVANDGELLVVDYSGGLYRIVPDLPGGQTGGPAAKLSETGCFNASDPTLPAPGLIPFTINDPFWSDGAVKERYLALPDNTTIREMPDGDFELPIGSVLVKHFRLAGQLIETRLFVRHNDGGWAGYTYEWNSSLTDADLVSQAGKDKMINGQLWHYPGRSECIQCHTTAAGFSLGVEGAQLNGDFTYSSSGRTANQLDTWESIGLFSSPLSVGIRSLALTDSGDTSVDLTLRARSYLHSNCGNCHRPGGTTQSNMDLRFSTPLSQMNTCDTVPQLGDLGITQARLLAPGNPGRSILLQRISNNDLNRMPPLGSNVLDTSAIGLLTDWINTVQTCP